MLANHDFRLSWIAGGNSSQSCVRISTRDDIPNSLGDLSDLLDMRSPKTEGMTKRADTWTHVGTLAKRLAARLVTQREGEISGGRRDTQPVRPASTGECAGDPREAHGEDVARECDGSPLPLDPVGSGPLVTPSESYRRPVVHEMARKVVARPAGDTRGLPACLTMACRRPNHLTISA